MVISRTPFRISLFGGGTDYPTWYRQHGGCVLAATIDKYCYLTCRYLPPFFEHRLKVVYSRIESVQTASDILHPAVRETLRYLKIDRGLEIHHDGDLPGRSGMGSSSSFTVGLLHALYALLGHMIGKERLAKESIHIEQEILKETVGSQDQVCAAYGGLNHITFSQNGEVAVRPLTITQDRVRQLNARLMLFYTGIKRTASDVASSYVNALGERSSQMQLLKRLVDRSLEILTQDLDLDEFGHLLHEAWVAKRSLSEMISNSDVDGLYAAARSSGALGGKLLGAGGGGFLLIFAPPDRHEVIKSKFRHLLHVPFEFEFSGSQIIFFDPEKDYLAQEQNRASQTINLFRELSSISEA